MKQSHETWLEKRREHYKANRERLLAYKHEWYATNREHVRAQKREEYAKGNIRRARAYACLTAQEHAELKEYAAALGIQPSKLLRKIVLELIRNPT